MKAEDKYPEYTDEMQKDLDRLEIIVERFSKVGAIPVLKPTDLNAVLHESVKYMRRRASSQIKINYNPMQPNMDFIPLNKSLFTWVIENLLKNSVDAMPGKGTINIVAFPEKNNMVIDITDTGKGIPRSKWKNVFQPGITTKQRGWGLGLSLAKRIINEYHKGNIAVKWSEPGKGTTIRITLNMKAG
jgi:signal transduction histidine kinase